MFVTRVTRRVPHVEQEPLPPSWAHGLTPFQIFGGVRVARPLVFCVAFCTSLFGLLSFIFWSLYCLSCVCLRLLITLLYLQSFLTYMWCFVLIDLKWSCWYCWPSLYELYFHQYFKGRKCYKRGGGGSISVYLARIFDRFYYLGDIAIDYNYHKTGTFVFIFF